MVIRNSDERKRKQVLEREKKKWKNSKLLKALLDEKLRAKQLEEKMREEEENKRKRLLELLSIK